jgi:hypothetical protein
VSPSSLDQQVGEPDQKRFALEEPHRDRG